MAVADVPTLHRLPAELYDRMVAGGLLAGEPVELVDGLLVHVTPQGPQHHLLVRRLIRHFSARGDMLHVQLPLAVPGGRPEPDVMLSGEDATLTGPPASAALVVEVCVSSWDDDRAKLGGYAAAAVGTVWLVNVPQRAVHVFEQPDPARRRYERERVFGRADTLRVPVDAIAPVGIGELFADFDA